MSKVFALNKRATHDYEIIDKYEAGIILYGWEAKAILNNKAIINNSHVILKNGEVFLLNSVISPGNDTSRFDIPVADRTRKLLLNKNEINKIIGKIKEKGLTVIPLKLYAKGKKYKLEIALARGKKEYDKRMTEKIKNMDLEVSKAIKVNTRKN